MLVKSLYYSDEELQVAPPSQIPSIWCGDWSLKPLSYLLVNDVQLLNQTAKHPLEKEVVAAILLLKFTLILYRFAIKVVLRDTLLLVLAGSQDIELEQVIDYVGLSRLALFELDDLVGIDQAELWLL